MRSFLFGVLILLSACACPPVVPLPLYPGLNNELLANAVEQADRFTSLKSMARVSIESDGQTTNFTQALLLEKPNRLRLDVLSPFGSTYLQAGTDGKVLKLFIPGKGKYFSGLPTPENFQLITRTPVDAEQMVNLLLYSIPLSSKDILDMGSRGQEGYVLELAAPDGRQVLWFNRERQPVASYWYHDATLIAEVVYGTLLGDPPFPREVKFSRPMDATSIKVVYTSPEPDAQIDEKLFTLEAPPGALVEPFPLLPARQ